LEAVELQFQAAFRQAQRHGTAWRVALALPERIHRLQRRHFYRIKIPLDAPLFVTIPPSRDNPKRTRELRANLIDVSMGGVCFDLLPSASVKMEPGQSLKDCKVDLGLSQILHLDLSVIRKTRGEATSGTPTRFSCLIEAIDHHSQALLKTYMDEREFTQRHIPLM
jgi:c-di-GMP-binding flagellar brake protein YcgR